MNIPPIVRDALLSAGADIEVFIVAVSHHEAAHAAVAIHHGAVVQKIELNQTAAGPIFSAARVVSKAGQASLLKQIDIVAAGPACDSMLKERFKIPQSIMDSTAVNERATVDQIIRGQSPEIYAKAQNMQGALDVFWRESIVRAREILSIPSVESFRETLGEFIHERLEAGTQEIPGADVERMWIEAGNALPNREKP